MDAPGFNGMTHGYGAPFGGFPDDEVVANTPEQEAHWAGQGFDAQAGPVQESCAA